MKTLFGIMIFCLYVDITTSKLILIHVMIACITNDYVHKNDKNILHSLNAIKKKTIIKRKKTMSNSMILNYVLNTL